MISQNFANTIIYDMKTKVVSLSCEWRERGWITAESTDISCL